MNLTTRSASIPSSSFDESARTVQAVMATETPATVFDWMRWEPVEEILVADGATWPEQLPLLDAHDRRTVSNVIGMVTDIKREGAEIVGTIILSETSQDVLTKIREGILRDVSIGYSVMEYEDLEPGASRTINGKTYTAGATGLRLSTSWEIKELSLVPIGADPSAKLRAETEHDDKSERARVLKLMEMGEHVTRSLVEQAIREGWTAEEAAPKFVADVTSRAAKPVPCEPVKGIPSAAWVNIFRNLGHDIATAERLAKVAAQEFVE